jgi:hypothetical protein
VNGHNRQQRSVQRKRRIARRLSARRWRAQSRPMLRARNILYDVADRTRATGAGGIGAMHLLARHTGLIDAIDEHLHVLKVHLPYHESDHVLNIAYNILSGGDCLEDLELVRNDEAYLDALGAQRIPDPTTAGDFCRRFTQGKVEILQAQINQVRLKVWDQQDRSGRFFEEAVIDVDGTLAPTTGACKQGMDYSYKGQWGYHPLVVSLANTREPLFLCNRPGHRPSHEGAACYIDQAIALCQQAGFESVLVRGDTDFTQSSELDRWDDPRKAQVHFVFGIDAHPKLVALAENLEEKAWQALRRPVRYEVKTRPRKKPENVKERIVVERGFQNIRLVSEQVAQLDYRPAKCQKTYRVVVVRKNLSVEKGEQVLFDDVRYFFYITNDRTTPADQIVTLANGRCEQENLIEQLKHGVQATRMPLDNLVSNWAYMVMASLAPPGVDAQGVAGALVARSGPVGPKVSRAETAGAADGVQTLRQRLHARARSDRAQRWADHLSTAVVEPLARGAAARRGSLAGQTAGGDALLSAAI